MFQTAVGVVPTILEPSLCPQVEVMTTLLEGLVYSEVIS